MNMKRRPKLRPAAWDGAVVGLVLALAVGCGVLLRGNGGSGEMAVVSINGEEVDRFSLAESAGKREYLANGYVLVVAVSSEGVRVAEAGCPTQDCVHTGVISRSGQSIVCLPGRFILRLAGGTERGNGPDVDAVIG